MAFWMTRCRKSVQHAERAFERAERQAHAESGPLRLGYSP
jgi:hypothetical protein